MHLTLDPEPAPPSEVVDGDGPEAPWSRVDQASARQRQDHLAATRTVAGVVTPITAVGAVPGAVTAIRSTVHTPIPLLRQLLPLRRPVPRSEIVKIDGGIFPLAVEFSWAGYPALF